MQSKMVLAMGRGKGEWGDFFACLFYFHAEFKFYKIKSVLEIDWCWFPNNVTIFKSTEKKKVKMVNFLTYILPQYKATNKEGILAASVIGKCN
jgi:hypothetical protein